MLASLVRKDEIDQAFIYLQLSHERILNYLHNRGGKTAISGINQTDAKTLQMVIHSQNILRISGKIITPLTESILERACENRIISQIHNTLLPNLISGEMRMPDAERMIGEP